MSMFTTGKDLFKEAVWKFPPLEELKTVSKKLQDYYSAKDADFMAIALVPRTSAGLPIYGVYARTGQRQRPELERYG